MIWSFDFVVLQDQKVVTRGRGSKEANDMVSAMEQIIEDVSSKFALDEAELIVECRFVDVALLVPSLTAGTGLDDSSIRLV